VRETRIAYAFAAIFHIRDDIAQGQAAPGGRQPIVMVNGRAIP